MGGQKMMQKTGQGVLRHSIRPAEAPARRPTPCLLYTLMSGGAVTNLNDQRAQKTMSRLVQGCFATPPAGAKASLCCLAIAVLVCACSGPSTLAETVIIADLRANYDASTPIAGQSSIGKIPDTLGTGSWNFYGAATVGGALTPLTYDTSADGGRLANAYTLQGQFNDLPAIANHEIYSGQGGNPPADAMAIHPASTSNTIQYLVVRWTAGAGSAGDVRITGENFSRVFSPNGGQNGTTFQILQDGATIFGSTVVAAQGGSVSFDLNRTVAVGDTVDFVLGNNGGWFYDQTYMSAAIIAVPEPSAVMLAVFGLLFAMTASARRRR